MSWENIVAIVIALVATVPGILAWQRQARKDKSDAASTLTGSALEMVEAYKAELAAVKAESEREMQKLRQRLQELEARVLKLEAENRQLRIGAGQLQNQVWGLGGTPCWSFEQLEQLTRGLSKDQ